jgi:hypothetical protein
MELLPLKNNYMRCAGRCVTAPFQSQSAGISQDPLLTSNEPYYPNLNEASKHWLPFPIYHGQSDARKQEIIFLLPETRAFLGRAQFRDGMLELNIGGTEVHDKALTVKGAYWNNGVIHHFDDLVRNGKAMISVPDINQSII